MAEEIFPRFRGRVEQSGDRFTYWLEIIFDRDHTAFFECEKEWDTRDAALQGLKDAATEAIKTLEEQLGKPDYVFNFGREDFMGMPGSKSKSKSH